VQLYHYFVSQSSEFCRQNPFCCFSTSVYFCSFFRYRLSSETFGYTLVRLGIRRGFFPPGGGGIIIVVVVVVVIIINTDQFSSSCNVDDLYLTDTVFES